MKKIYQKDNDEELILKNHTLKENSTIVERTSTDTIFIYVFGIIFCLWILGHDASSDYHTIDMIDFIRDFSKLLYESGGAVIILRCIFIASLMIYGFLKMLVLAPRAFVYLGLFALGIYICFSVSFVMLLLSVHYRRLGFALLHPIVIPLIGIITLQTMIVLIVGETMVSVYRTSVKSIADIIQKSCCAIFFYRFLTLFGLCIILLLVSVSVYTLTVKVTLIGVMTLMGGIYIDVCILNFGQMVISESVAKWHSTPDKDSISPNNILKSVRIICRFHLGTVALGSMPLVPFGIALQAAWRMQCFASIPDKNNPSIVSKIQKKFSIVYSPYYALFVTAMYGINFVQATKKTISLLRKSPSLTIKTTIMINTILISGSAITLFLSTLTSVLFFQNYLPDVPIVEVKYISIITTVVLLIPPWLIVFTAVLTTMLHSLDNSKENKRIEVNADEELSISAHIPVMIQ